MRLKDRVAVVTGSGGPMGRAVAEKLVAEGAEAVIRAALEQFGGIDLLVNIVGGVRGSLNTPLLAISEADWDFVMALNLRGGLNCTQLAVPHMLDKQYGKIVNISSVVAPQGAPGQAHYSAAKAGVIAFTKTAAREFGPHVNVNCILPGLIQTSVMERMPAEEMRKFRETVPLQRFG